MVTIFSTVIGKKLKNSRGKNEGAILYGIRTSKTALFTKLSRFHIFYYPNAITHSMNSHFKLRSRFTINQPLSIMPKKNPF